MPVTKPPFQAMTIKAKAGRLDKLITNIEVCEAFDHAAPPNPLPTRLGARALWDTGASRSVLSVDFIKQLGLAKSGLAEVHHGDGSSMRDTYMANFYLPNGVAVVGLTVTDFPASHKAFSVLVGMDVIGVGDFSVTNLSGNTCMSFRTPSHATVDYVVEANKIMFANMGRNEPCYCGSGEKFKKCHGLNL